MRRKPATALRYNAAHMGQDVEWEATGMTYIHLAYGTVGLNVDFPPCDLTVVAPQAAPALPDADTAIITALRAPIAHASLADTVRGAKRVVIVHSDLTRPTPNQVILPPILRELERACIPDDAITMLNGTGMHRPNTPVELTQMLGAAVTARYRCLNHDAFNPADLTDCGETHEGNRVLVNTLFREADAVIVTGFIEPHFFAGFSGGPKGVVPGIAGEATVLHNHGARHIRDAGSTWGVTDGNPLWEEIAEAATLAIGGRPCFLVNVTLNNDKAVTGVYAGDLFAAHRAGIAAVRTAAMQPVSAPFDIVITTNSGYPLDLNLYQTIKGVSAANRVLKDGGTIIAVAECREGLPEHGNYKRILQMARTPDELVALIESPGFRMFDQWEAHIQGLIQRRARLLLYSTIPDEDVRAAHIEPIHDIPVALSQLLNHYGPTARVCVLPEGPQTIPYLPVEALQAAVHVQGGS